MNTAGKPSDNPLDGKRCSRCGGSRLRMTCEAKQRVNGWEFIQRTGHCLFCGHSTQFSGGGPI
jgi:hypothetical protein